MDRSRELGRLLGVKFWEVSPLNADSEEPPKWIRNNPLQLVLGQSMGAAMRVRSGRAMTGRLCFF
jgi:hypothetical protein